MSNQQNAIFAIFRQPTEAAKLTERLRHAGFRDRNIRQLKTLSKANLGWPRGISFGAPIGGTLGIFAGLFVCAAFFDSETAFMIPVFMIMGLVLGSASGTLVGIGIPETQLRRYAQLMNEGATLVYLRTTETAKALPILLQSMEMAGGMELAIKDEHQTLDEIYKHLGTHRFGSADHIEPHLENTATAVADRYDSYPLTERMRL